MINHNKIEEEEEEQREFKLKIWKCNGKFLAATYDRSIIYLPLLKGGIA